MWFPLTYNYTDTDSMRSIFKTESIESVGLCCIKIISKILVHETTVYDFFWFCGLAGWSFCPSCCKRWGWGLGSAVTAGMPTQHGLSLGSLGPWEAPRDMPCPALGFQQQERVALNAPAFSKALLTLAKSHCQGQSERGKGLSRAWRWEQIGATPATIYHRYVQLSLNKTIEIF